VKEFLSRERVPFTERNVEEDETAYDELIALGFRSVPVAVVGGRPVKGFDREALAAAVAEWKQGQGRDG
jgi:glutaredoxin